MPTSREFLVHGKRAEVFLEGAGCSTGASGSGQRRLLRKSLSDNRRLPALGYLQPSGEEETEREEEETAWGTCSTEHSQLGETQATDCHPIIEKNTGSPSTDCHPITDKDRDSSRQPTTSTRDCHPITEKDRDSSRQPTTSTRDCHPITEKDRDSSRQPTTSTRDCHRITEDRDRSRLPTTSTRDCHPITEKDSDSPSRDINQRLPSNHREV
ncbi:uncharacterized protein LOC120914555 [Rana temporaria]|uniref:uncharacterized protein LOC120914555 n=1 Tax=Rana temporaria TaxID=8407 RepID=UPI001AADB098|nr:uncharacterized protein LOC120914555 [Rana temporaria]